MSRASMLAITIAALSVLGMPLTAVAPHTFLPMLPRLHGDVCRSTFLRAARCEPGLLHTLQSVQGCLPDQLFSLAKLRPPGAAARCDKDCTRHEVCTRPVKATG